MVAAKVALVTASSAGLGAACVRALASHYRVVVNYHSRLEKAQELVRSAEQVTPIYKTTTTNDTKTDDEPRFHIVQADVTRRDEIDRLVAETVSTMGRLDLVVSNTGWTRMTNFFDFEQQLDEQDWDRCFNANVKSHLWLFRAAKPHLEKSASASSNDDNNDSHDTGAFVTVASVAGVRPGGSSLPYSTTKAALVHLTKGLAVISGPKIRCNSVSPGLMLTEWGAQFPESKVSATRAKAALKGLASPEDVAEQVKYLALSRSITGQNVVIDCGIAI